MKLGNIDIKDLKLGETQIQKIMQGSSLVWEKILSSGIYMIVVGYHTPNPLYLFNTVNGNYANFTPAGMGSEMTSKVNFEDKIVYSSVNNGGLSIKTYNDSNNTVTNQPNSSFDIIARDSLGSSPYLYRNYYSKDSTKIYSAMYNLIARYITLSGTTYTIVATTSNTGITQRGNSILASSTGKVYMFSDATTRKLYRFNSDLSTLEATSQYNTNLRYTNSPIIKSNGNLATVYNTTMYEWSANFSNDSNPLVSQATIPYVFIGNRPILRDKDGNFILIDYSSNSVVKFSENFSSMWKTTISSSSGTVHILFLKTDIDGNIYGTWGNTYSGYSTGAFKLDSSGNILWQKDLRADLFLSNDAYLTGFGIPNEYVPNEYL